jgi:hypothetical protein
MTQRIATGIEYEPLGDGLVRIRFFDDDCLGFNQQVVKADVLRAMPLVAALTDVAIKRGPAVAKEIMSLLADEEAGEARNES